MIGLVLVDVWQWTPLITLITLAGLKRGAEKTAPSPHEVNAAVELLSSTQSVEWAAVVRKPRARAAGMLAPTRPAPPQLMMIRCLAKLNSKASVEAQPTSACFACGGGPASTSSTACPALTR